MTSVVQLLPLAGVWAVALASPGPDFVATAQYATSRSRRDGVLVGLGVTSALAIWVSASMVGLAVLLSRLGWLYDTVRLVGVAYLAYLGVRLLLSARSASGREVSSGAGVAPAGRSGWATWRVGFLTNIGNPKAAVFFGSLFTALLPAHSSVWLRVGVVVAMLGMAFAWFTAVACLFSLPPIARGYRRLRRAIDALTGCVFLVLAGRLATD